MKFVNPEVQECYDRLSLVLPDYKLDPIIKENFAWISVLHVSKPNAHLRISFSQDKWVVSVIWPQSKNNVFLPSTGQWEIKVSSERPNEVLRKDIQRRLLDPYYEVLDEQVQRRDEEVARENNFVKVRDELLTMVNERLPKDNTDRESYRIDRHNIAEIRVLSGGKKAAIRTNYLPVEAAKKLIEFLKTIPNVD